jgi:hypothetical protein
MFASRNKPTKVVPTIFFQKRAVRALTFQTKKSLGKTSNFSQSYSSFKMRCFQKKTPKDKAKFAGLITHANNFFPEE